MLLNSLPYTRKEIVSSKYIVVVLFTSMVLQPYLSYTSSFTGNLRSGKTSC
ncbi:ABC-2 transporter permease [Bacillus licheniformis]|nr:ABC-2 transporter permease [Bacillus licheniformis]